MKINPVRLLFASAAWGGSAYHRMYLPSMFLRTLPEVESMMTTNIDYNAIESFKPNAVIAQWVYGEQSLNFLRWCQSKRIKVFVDIDDDVWSLQDKTEWTEDKIKSFEEIIIRSDGVVVATKTLREIIKARNLNKNIVVSGNYIDLSSFSEPVSYENARLRVGWYGSASHEQDFPEVVCDWIKQLSENWDIIIFGYMPINLEGHVRFIKGVEPTIFMKILQQLKLDIGIIVCDVDMEFNKAKTPIKLLELGALGIPIVCTRAAPYLPFLDYIQPMYLTSLEYAIFKRQCYSRPVELRQLIKEKHSWQMMKDEVWNSYKSLYEASV